MKNYFFRKKDAEIGLIVNWKIANIVIQLKQ